MAPRVTHARVLGIPDQTEPYDVNGVAVDPATVVQPSDWDADLVLEDVASAAAVSALEGQVGAFQSGLGTFVALPEAAGELLVVVDPVEPTVDWRTPAELGLVAPDVDGNVSVAGGAGAEGINGGQVALIAGDGDNASSLGAYINLAGGAGNGTHGGMTIRTAGEYGVDGQVLTRVGPTYAEWADLPAPPAAIQEEIVLDLTLADLQALPLQVVASSSATELIVVEAIDGITSPGAEPFDGQLLFSVGNGQPWSAFINYAVQQLFWYRRPGNNDEPAAGQLGEDLTLAATTPFTQGDGAVRFVIRYRRVGLI